MSDKLTILETMKMLNSADFDESSEAEKIISMASTKAREEGIDQRIIDEIISYYLDDEDGEFKNMDLVEKAKEIKHQLENFNVEYRVTDQAKQQAADDKEEKEDPEGFAKKIKLMDSKEKTEAKQDAVVPAGMGALAGRDDMSQKIVAKLMSISKALADEFGYDQKMVLQDMINDLRIAGGEAVEDIVKGDTPIEQMTKEMAAAFKGIGLDSNIALNFLLQMDEKQAVEQFRKFLNKGGLLPNKEKPKAIDNKNMTFLESFKQRLLVESIDEVYTKFYSDVPREKFNELIRLDPTFREDQDKLGDYGRWIINVFKQKTLKERDFSRVNEILFDFNDRKRFLTTLPNGKDAKNIFNYKTLDEIRTALDNIQLTANQIAKQARKAKQHADLGEQAEFIGENDKWEIWKPKTYAASCKLGAGTTWCTASTSYQGHYDSYTRRGNLYIFISKEDKTIKYQVHIDEDNHVTTFMDRNDRPSIEFSTFIFNEKLLPVIKQTVLKNADAIVDVENMESLSKGEPFVYTGGRVKQAFITAIKTVVFPKDYNKTDIPGFAFAGCVNLEQIYLPKQIDLVGIKAFKGCDKMTILTPKHKVTCFQPDFEFLKGKFKYISEEEMKYAI